MNILCIGNSFSVDTTWLIPQIAGDLGVTDIHFGNLYVGGCSVRMHLAHLEENAPVYKFYDSRGGEWEAREESTIAAAIASERWDWISIQHGTKDGSRYSKAESYEALPRLVQLVKQLAGAETKIAFNMTWVGDQDKPKSEMPEYMGRLEDLYRDIAGVTRDLIVPMEGIDRVCPTGTAIQNFRMHYDGPMTRDGYHLTKDLGRYIAGLAFLKALTEADITEAQWLPEGMTRQDGKNAIRAVEQAMESPFSVKPVIGKTVICMIRHGESQANKRDAFLGHCDLPLTEQGIAQAELAAQFLKNSGADAVYSSDLTRAHETAKRTAALLGLTVKTDPNLREIDAGLWDNLTFAELREKYAETFGIWVNDIGHAGCDGGETVFQLKRRVMGALHYIARANVGKKVLVFAHGTPIRIAGCVGMGKPLAELGDVPWAANASTTTLEYENGSFRLIEYSREDYMGELVTKLPDDV